jgi:hypothetical protein
MSHGQQIFTRLERDWTGLGLTCQDDQGEPEEARNCDSDYIVTLHIDTNLQPAVRCPKTPYSAIFRPVDVKGTTNGRNQLHVHQTAGRVILDFRMS